MIIPIILKISFLSVLCAWRKNLCRKSKLLISIAAKETACKKAN